MNDIAWRNSIKRELHGTWSHPDPFNVLDGLDSDAAGRTVKDFPHSIWQLAVHMVDWGWEIVNIVRGDPIRGYQDDNYFPADPAPPDAAAWDELRNRLKTLAVESEKLVDEVDPTGEVTAWKMSNADALSVLVGHNAYHTGQMVALRRLLGVWMKAEG